MEKKREPRVLVISHNVFSETGNMGKTMKDMLSCLQPENLAQLYFHSERPTTKCCLKYYRITDTDVLYSLISRKAGGKTFDEAEIDENAVSSRIDTGLKADIYQFARRRTPSIYILRNMLWKAGVWDSVKLETWISEFRPDLIFFASGDYSFAYRVTETIAKKFDLPVVTWCCDDHYIGRPDHESILYRINKRNLMKWVNRVMQKTRCVITISDKMQNDYRIMFQRPTVTMRISAGENRYKRCRKERNKVVYVGNLGVNRISSIIELGSALRKAAVPGLNSIDVFSGEKNPQILAQLTEKNGIHYHGAVSPEEVEKILGSARYVIHVEAFDEKSKMRTRFSLSTKIGECLQSGACILAYGPQDISSMEYLQEHSAAVCSDKTEQLIRLMLEAEKDDLKYDMYVRNATELAEKNHNQEKNRTRMKELLIHAADL